MAEAVKETVETMPDGLGQPRWAVISFEKCEGGNLPYAAAVDLLNNLDSEGVAGLCIVADEVAARLAA